MGLVIFAKKARDEKWGYVWGTFGQVLTEALLKQKLIQFPSEVGKYEGFIRTNWLGRRVSDCIGLIKSYIWFEDIDNDNILDQNEKINYDALKDVNVGGMYDKATEKGPISTIPEIPGICVCKEGHIGIYIGNGQVIEAHGTKYGVIQTPLRGAGATTWTNWLKCPFIEYIKEEKPMGKVFTDVEDNRWSAKHIEAAKNLGLIDGTGDGNFNPAGNLTREQAAVLMVRLYEKITGKKVV